MAKVFRKKPTSVIRTNLSQPERSRSWFNFIKPIIVVLCLILAYGVYNQWNNWLSLLDSSPIKSYALTHKTKFTTNADIRGVLSEAPDLKGYFGQDIQELKDRFLSLSWIRDVSVRKIYPDRLSITLLEHVPVARWNDEHLVSQQGVVFDLPKDRFDSEQLPAFYGPDISSKKVLDAWYKIQKDLESRKLVLKSISMDIRGSWSIVLDNQVELRLGRGDWLPKIDRFVTIFPEIEIPEEKRLSYVDLRYEHGASVGFIQR
ncbi:cell division protein FtsQ/DivIB [Otariodibacter oris]|uniref:Cell division protein FtsQ n=1 Tax=Otariodibacter oris TaxID=1032623 RepID=A0A420XJF9_9PAST|nr:cell division protein FtsQ/DivIB [Otariodibacter oris]QGM80413.1 cell division protein FtsQ [Otariodibacter oris]RKR77442.1 cell division protein FtsQ [Otariodibacter oris]